MNHLRVVYEPPNILSFYALVVNRSSDSCVSCIRTDPEALDLALVEEVWSVQGMPDICLWNYSMIGFKGHGLSLIYDWLLHLRKGMVYDWVLELK